MKRVNNVIFQIIFISILPKSTTTECKFFGVLIAGDEIKIDKETEEYGGRNREEEEENPQGKSLESHKVELAHKRRFT